MIGVCPTGSEGHVAREISHALECGGHPQRGHDDPQIRGDRLLQGEHRDACGFDLFFEFVDFAVPDYHLLCQIEDRAADGDPAVIAQLWAQVDLLQGR